MSRAQRSLTESALLILLLFSLFLFRSEARQVKGMDYYSLKSIKHSGPSHGGPGHRSGKAQFPAYVRDSGPSSGVGHSYFRGMHQ